MNAYLKSSVSRYPKELKKTLISPLSETDGKIITELIAVVEKAGLTKVKEILNSYKYLKDIEILKSLADLNARGRESFGEGTDVPPEKDKLTQATKMPPLFVQNWIYLKDLRINASDIQCYERNDEYIVSKGVISYQIILNRLSEATAIRNVTTHKIIDYMDIEQRDADFCLLDDYMSSVPGVRFINERPD
jgi:hypothetical protein